jgi:pimeloyl-ACP methyl ester carboxylesterase
MTLRLEPGMGPPNHVRVGRMGWLLSGYLPRRVGNSGRNLVATLVSERVGQFFLDGHRLEYTEYGAGERWVVLLHGQLMPRRMHQPLARAIAAEGFHVVTVDLLGHGRSDRPLDPKGYSMTAFGEQVVALLDHLGADQAVIGGTSLGANVSLEVADAAPQRVRGLILEMPVLDNALEAGLIAFGPLMFMARFAPLSIDLTRRVAKLVSRGLVPFWVGIGLDTMNQQPAPMAAAIHGIFFGRIAPSSKRRRQIDAPALVVGHPRDPIHPAADAAMLADEMPHATFVAARSILEWRSRPERLDAQAVDFVTSCWSEQSSNRRARRS